MNAPSISSLMEFGKSRLQYFLIVTQILILIISIYNIINTPSEKFWILAIVLSSLVSILVFSIFGNNENKLNKSSIIQSKTNENNSIYEDTSNEKIPDVLEEGWDLPL